MNDNCNIIIMKIRYLFFLLLVLLSAKSWSQDYSIRNKKAILAFETALKSYQLYDYETAKKFLDEALKKEDKFIEAYFLYGEIFLETKKPQKAIENFEKALDLDPDFNPKLYFSSAEASLQLGEYEGAKATLDRYLNSKNVSIIGKERANKYLEICKFAIVQKANPVPFDPINLGENINSRNAEYLPSLTADEQTLVITVRRPRDMYTTTLSAEEEDFFISKKIHENGQKQSLLAHQ